MAKIQHTPTTVETATPVIETPAQQPEAAPAATPPASVAEVQLTSAQLKQRLDETRVAAERRVLAELGVDNLDKAKELVAKAAPRNDEKWSALEAKTSEQEAQIAELQALVSAVTTERAVNALSSLPEQARKAIEDATDDPEERLALVQVFNAAGMMSQPAAAPVVAQSVQQPVAASTAPPRTAPVDATATTPNRREEYDRLKKENPVAAAHYLKRYSRDIFPAS